MADNYIEKKMEACRSGRTIIRKVNPSLDILLGRIGKDAVTGGEAVKQAQLDAIVRSAALVSSDFSAEVSEAGQTISVGASDGFTLGETVLAMRLKASELGLSSVTEAAGDNKLILKISKN